MQDFRGRYASGGNFDFWFNCSTDANDTLVYLMQQSWSSGVFFTQGGSANGITQYFQELGNPDPTVLRGQYVQVRVWKKKKNESF